jgi:TRAP-type C4-dicarboxylate transport system permease small subunit
VKTTWYNSIAEFPDLSAGVTYMPIPVAGVVMLLFVIERRVVRRSAADLLRLPGPAESE